LAVGFNCQNQINNKGGAVMTRKYFGTDGIRGRVGQYPITPDFVLKLGWAAGRVFSSLQQSKHSKSKVVIGKDTRISGYMFESALEAGFSAAGVDIALLGPMPTPAIAYLTRTLHADMGIVISASHNPYYDNGIKFFSYEGQKLSDEVELAIEKELEKPLEIVSSEQLGKAVRIDDAVGRYIEFCKSTVPSYLTLSGLNIIVDCANGATYHIAPSVFRELGAEVIEIAADPDGININETSGATQPKYLQKIILNAKADLGIALDGDGDRVILVDHKGEIVDGDEILFILARYLKEKSQLSGGVVGTQMSNFGLEIAFKELDIDFVRSKVGDRYVMEALLKNQWSLGGEGSGHIIYLDATSTGDGIVSALQILKIMVETKKSLHELKHGMKKLPQTLINITVKDKKVAMSNPALKKAMIKAEGDLKGMGRILLRPSGTEPLIRVMVESESEQLSKKVAESVANVIEPKFGS